MAAKVPIRTVYTNSVATGLAEFQSGEFVDYTSGGTGLAALGSAGQVLKVNSGASALEYGNVEAVINIEGMTDGSGVTLAAADKFVFSDGGTEKYLLASQIDTYVSATSSTLTNKTLTAAQLTSAVLNTGVSGSAIKDQDDMSSNSASHLATQQSIKAYVDTQITAEDLDITTDSGTIAIDLDSETLTISGGTGLSSSATGNAITLAIDSTVTTLAGTQTLTNKTLTNPTITGGTFSGTFTGTQDLTGVVLSGASPLVFEGATADAYETTLSFTDPTADRVITVPNATDTLVGKATTDTLTNKSVDLGNNTLTGSLAEFNTALQSESFASLSGSETLTNKTLTSPILNTGVSGSAIKDQDDMNSDSATHLATQQSIKAYVDAQVASENTLAEDNDVNITSAADGSLLLYDTISSTWRDAAMSGDATITDTGVITLGANSVDSAEITAGAIDLAHMSVNSVDSDQYVDGSIDLVHLSANSVDSDQYVDGSIDLVHMSANSVDSDQYVDGSIDLVHMSANSVDSDQYVDGSVDNVHLANSSITVSDGSTSTATSLGGTVTFSGTSNEVTVAESSGTITIGLPDDVTISGNLTVSGTQTTVSSTTVNVADPLLHLATNNGAADAVDIGLYGLYDTSGSQDLYGGIFRDASDGKWRLFKDNQAVPTTTVNTSGTGYAVASMVANLEGNVTGAVTGNATTSTALATGRTIASTGDVVWTSASFDGSGNVTGTAAIGTGVIVNADINSSAAIAFSKMADLTTSRLLVSDGSGDVSVSAVTSTEAGYLDGVTSAIQTQMDTKSTKAFAIAQAVALG